MTLIYDPDGRERPAIYHDPATGDVRAAPPVYFAPLDAEGHQSDDFRFVGHLLNDPFTDPDIQWEVDPDGSR